ncbi:MAG: hypothetical protein E6J20_19445 [Chloroflexi bacterium]|nr:MAG: hypothetical protein E6J20_19445 [Chloroflexota bacterium]
MDQSDALTDWILANPTISTLVGLGLLALTWLWVHLGTRGDPPGKVGKPRQPVRTEGYRPDGAVFIPLELGPVVIDLQPGIRDTLHVGIGGTTGLGKSASVLSLFDLPIGILVCALDNTGPITGKVRSLPDGVEWTNDPAWGVGLDILQGPPRLVSEGLVAGYTARTSQDTGKYRRFARMRLWSAIEQLDAWGIERNLPDLVLALGQRSGEVEIDRACRDWAGQLTTLAKTLGPALGSDLDLVAAMRQRKKVLLRLNRFLSPEDAPMLGGMLLVHTRRAAEEAGVPFVIVVEEAGQLGQYQAQISALAQAGRDRGTPLVIISQNLSLLPLEVRNNASVWVSFAQEDEAELRFAGHKMRLKPEQLEREAFPDLGKGWCYVRAPGVPTTLVHVRKASSASPRRRVSVADAVAANVRTPENGHSRVEIIELERMQRPGLPAPGADMLDLLERVYRDGECERWSGKHDRAGHKVACTKECEDKEHADGCYGLVWWPLEEPRLDPKTGKLKTHEWQRVHRVRWRLSYGPIPLGDDGRPLTVDHRRTCPKDCSRLDHLVDLCTGSENSRRRWRVRGVSRTP